VTAALRSPCWPLQGRGRRSGRRPRRPVSALDWHRMDRWVAGAEDRRRLIPRTTRWN